MNFVKVKIKVSSPSNMPFLIELSIGNFLKGITRQHISLVIVLQLPILAVERLTNNESAGVH